MTNVRVPSSNLCLNRYDWALDRVSALRDQLPSRIVFDIGPGDGRMRKIEKVGFSWHGFDLKAWQDVSEWNLDKPCPVQDKKAGGAFLLDVIEHCVNPGLALQHIGDAMAIGGRLVLTTPNPSWSGSRAYMLFRGYVSSFNPDDLVDNHHILPIWPHALERMLEYAGFVVDDYVTLDGKTTLFQQPGKLRGLKRYVINAGQMLLERRDTNACGSSYGVVARKVSDSPLAQAYPDA